MIMTPDSFGVWFLIFNKEGKRVPAFRYDTQTRDAICFRCNQAGKFIWDEPYEVISDCVAEPIAGAPIHILQEAQRLGIIPLPPEDLDFPG